LVWLIQKTVLYPAVNPKPCQKKMPGTTGGRLALAIWTFKSHVPGAIPDYDGFKTVRINVLTDAVNPWLHEW